MGAYSLNPWFEHKLLLMYQAMNAGAAGRENERSVGAGKEGA